MDDNVLSYLGVKSEEFRNEEWVELSSLEQVRDIVARSSSTCEYQVHWGFSPVIIGEERHHEEI